MHRLALAVFLTLVFIPAAPAMAQEGDDAVAADAAAVPAAQVAQETTPEEPPAEEDPDEEEFGEEIPEEPVPEEEPEPEVEEEPPPPAPVAAPAQELPRTGTDTRIFAIAGLALLTGLALRRVTRPN